VIPETENSPLPDREPTVTEGIKYAGSKLKIIPRILDLAGQTGARTVLDGFSGTTRVSQAFARSGYRVIANDSAVWSETFATCYLLDHRGPDHYRPLIDHLNSLEGKRGWFTERYGAEPGTGTSVGMDGLKKPWQVRNTMRLDAIREEIDRMGLDGIERSVLLTSLILALDRVDSTIGHYASYLREWSRRSFNELRLEVPRLIPASCPPAGHSVTRKDIFELLPEVEADLAYFDPPYGSNNDRMPPSRVRYGAYYHLWTSICLNDKPELFGKAMRRADSADPESGSVFEDFRKGDSGRYLVADAIERLVREVRARYVLLSYSSAGRASLEDLREILSGAGTIVHAEAIDYRLNVMSGMRWTNEWTSETKTPHREVLFLVEKCN
jgi:adenine-specific DNA-methyltransferase